MWRFLLFVSLLLSLDHFTFLAEFHGAQSAGIQDSSGKQEQQPQPCVARSFGHDSVVCVCNSTHCDTVASVPSLNIGEGVLYTSSKAGLRFSQQRFSFSKGELQAANLSFTINVTSSKRYQQIKGFGGAFTDAASINIMSLSQKAQDHLLMSYFSTEGGIEYNMGRIPMASCDFSTHQYTYDDFAGDFDMKNFSLAQEDLQYKIPLIQRSASFRGKPLKLFGSPWSAPAWLKTNNALHGFGTLVGHAGDQYHRAWALYFARFVEEYKARGVDLWGLTVQNEPNDGFVPNFSFQCMGMTAEQQRDFVKMDLGPTLHSRGHSNISLMIIDGQRLILPKYATTILSDPDAAKFVSGIAVHWYTDMIVPADKLSETHHLHPDYFILGTEACVGQLSLPGDKVELGSWSNGKRYSDDIFEDLNHWVTGWVDWNLALDHGGGPNWAKNFVDSPVIVNAAKDEFYKQPMFYHLGHFSKFLPEGATRIGVQASDEDPMIKFVAFLHPDNATVTLVMSSAREKDTEVVINDASLGAVHVHVPSHSIQTLVLKTAN